MTERREVSQPLDANPSQPGRQCVTCGRTIDWQANVCQYCGHDYRVAAVSPTKRKSAKPAIGGVLILVAGLCAVGMGGMFLAFDASDFEDWGYDPSQYEMSLSDVDDILGVCGGLVMILGLVAILGGVFAIMRKGFALAIIGGICGIIGIGFLLGSVLSLVGLILVAMAKDEF